MTTRGDRLREFMEARWVALDPTNRRYGMQAEIQRRTGIKRQTMRKWFSGVGEPDLRRLAALAELLQVSRADLLAAFDGTPRDRPLPDILSDADRRRRRKWWLGVARATANLTLGQARDAFAARGIRSDRGNLASLWEDPNIALEPNAQQLRVVAEIYRLPLEELAAIWNNPPSTDEEELVARRGGDLELVREGGTELPAERERRTA